MKLVYGACFYPDPENAGAYLVVVPDLPGCSTWGSNLADAIVMAIDAASGWVLDELEGGKDIPNASPLAEIKLDEDMGHGFVNAIVLDMDEYAEKYGNKSVRKNVTIPNWLNTKAEQADVNFSHVLQQALIELLGFSSRRNV
jgi:predicted RNase H-like HicB family nuclease